MTKAHCDRCDVLLTGTDNIPRLWLSEHVDSKDERIYHLCLYRSSFETQYDLCKTCLTQLLQQYIDLMAH